MSEMIVEKHDRDSLGLESEAEKARSEANNFILQLFVFHGENYLGWNCFNKGKISVGRGQGADLVLDDPSLSDIQAVFCLQDDQIRVINASANGGVLVNGKTIETFVLGPLDFVSIGQYSLKVKVKRIENQFFNESQSIHDASTCHINTDQMTKEAYHKKETEVKDEASDSDLSEKDVNEEKPVEDFQRCERYKLVFEGEIIEGYTIKGVKANLVALLRAEQDQIEQLFSGRRVVIKKDTDYQTATQYVRSFEKAGAKCLIEIIQRDSSSVTDPLIQNELPEVHSEEGITKTEETEPHLVEFEKEEIKEEYLQEETVDDNRYKVVFDGRITEGKTEEDVKANLSTLLNREKSIIAQFFSGKRIIIKNDTDLNTAIQYKKTVERTGAICIIEPVKRNAPPETQSLEDINELYDSNESSKIEFIKEETENISTVPESIQIHDNDEIAEKQAESGAVEPAEMTEIEDETTNADTETNTDTDKHISSYTIQMDSAAVIEDDDEEEEDDEDEEGLHFLKERFLNINNSVADQTDSVAAIEVVKLREDNVVDVSFLSNKEKYYSVDTNGRFCLAENKDSDHCYFYFNDTLHGHVCINGSSKQDISTLCIKEKLYQKRKKIYRDFLPKDGDVLLHDGYYDYMLRRVIRNHSPKVPEPPKEKKHVYNNLVKSAGFHIIFVIFLSLFISLPDPPGPPPPESRFVQVDTRDLIKKKPPVQKPPVQKPKEIKPVKKTTPKKTVKKSKTSKKRVVARSPKAGGGSGKKGNVLNRNVNQTGILGMIGDSIGFKPKEALAVVTNLDAVSSSHSSEGNFKVGGIVGKLDSSRIEIPSAGIVNTQGSNQVLRSAGIKGKGTVAALEKGKTGEGKVMAMVSAELDKKVRIRGGMSREAVKKVIDRHLDEITYCYESALIANPSIMGKVVFEWKILMSGRVGEVRIKSSSINSSEIHSCIKESIKTWQFPQPRGQEVIVSYPFIFDIVGF
ncbi:MAG: AgmX/PglI C-terminal domain-containing protein [Thermodesulfobacteriota bacterium]|nr:AgmX/PglI C-terminal domain-containing protein [Thermodesulfobacteriota bacterium]